MRQDPDGGGDERPRPRGGGVPAGAPRAGPAAPRPAQGRVPHRGGRRRPSTPYWVQSRCYAWPASPAAFLDDADNPYTTPDGHPFTWIRARQGGGRLIVRRHAPELLPVLGPQLQGCESRRVRGGLADLVCRSRALLRPRSSAPWASSGTPTASPTCRTRSPGPLSPRRRSSSTWPSSIGGRCSSIGSLLVTCRTAGRDRRGPHRRRARDAPAHAPPLGRRARDPD